jgi:hypothetical protein
MIKIKIIEGYFLWKEKEEKAKLFIVNIINLKKNSF